MKYHDLTDEKVAELLAAHKPNPLHLAVGGATRVVVENRDGRLVAEVQRRSEGEWVTFAEASKGGAGILLEVQQ